MKKYKVPVSCNKDCGGGCPLLAHVEDGRLVKITDNPLGTRYMTGCVRGFQMPRVVYHRDRLKQPLLRSGARGSGEFKEISWSEALTMIAEKLTRAKAEHGAASILPLGGGAAERGALHNTQVLMKRFFGMLGDYTATYNYYSADAEKYVRPYVFGTADVGLDPATLAFSRLIILWGANIVDTRLGCEMERYLAEAKERGVKIIAIDPRRSRTVKKLASRWIPVLPGRDTVLMAAVLYVLLNEKLVNREFIARFSVGFAELENYILGTEDNLAKTPAWAAGICGTPEQEIVRLARDYGTVKPAALIPGLSIQRTIGGEEAARMAAVLQVATGNVGIRGGSTGWNVWGRLPEPECGVIAAPEPEKKLKVSIYRWPDVVLGGRAAGYPGDIKVIYNVGSNLLSQGSDISKNIRAFEKAEFSVCHDYFLTPTANYCDIVLPVTTFLEREDIVFPGINYLFYSGKVIEPLYNSKNDFDIFCLLADKLGFGPEFSENRSASDWLTGLAAASEIPDFEEFKRSGIYAGKEQLRTGLSDFIADPDLHPLSTPSGRIEISSADYYEATGFSPFPDCRIFLPDADHPLQLITPHPRYRIHSQYANIGWFRERGEHHLMMNPLDAESRGIRDGEKVIVSNPQGRVRVVVRLTEDISRGVVSLDQGM